MPGHHIIVGGGLAGLTAAMKLAEQGEQVDLFSIVPVKRSHSVCAAGRINGAVNTKGEGDSPMIHFVDTVNGGDFLAHQPPVKAMCEAAPSIIYLFDRMGVMFDAHARGPARLPPLRRHASIIGPRSPARPRASSCSTRSTSRCRRYEAAGLIRKFEGWEIARASCRTRIGRLPRHRRDRHALAWRCAHSRATRRVASRPAVRVWSLAARRDRW